MDGAADGEPAAAAVPNEHSWWRRHPVGVVAAAGFVLLAGWSIGAWVTRPHAPDYSGQTRAASFDFDCYNGIFWRDSKTAYGWWAGHNPVVPDNFDTAPTTPGDPPYHHSTGQLHFENETQATYTSDAGGQLRLTRQPLHQFYLADCVVNGAK
jgi:hypothetical protein